MDYKYSSNHEGQDIRVSKEIRLEIIYTPVFAISLKGSDEYAKETEN